MDDAKLYELTFHRYPEYLYACISAKNDSYKISIAYWSEIAAECERLGVTKLLVEEDIPDMLSMGEMFEVASDISMLGLTGVRIAFVDRYPEQQKVNEFGALVATNRGVHGKIFKDLAAAREWLNAE